MPNSVIVVGAGIVGACVAYQLSRDGAEVTLIERAPAPGMGVTANSFAWIGEGGHWPGGAADLRPHILADHRRLSAEVPTIPLRWCGSLTWPASREPEPTSREPEPASPEPAAREPEPLPFVGPDEISRLEPNLRAVPAGPATHSPTDGAVDAAGMATALVEATRSLGARVLLGTTATATTARSVTTDRDHLTADAVVLATGAALTEPSPALLIRAAAPPGLVRMIVSAPGFEVRESRPGELLFAAEPDADPAAVVVRFRAAWSGAEKVRVLNSTIGVRPMPPGGPMIGYAPDGTYLAVMHSAVCLAPTAARLIAQEIVSGHPALELARCRPANASADSQ
ncbi:FAD-dependent oxidoreductase [Actinoplanes sp. NPDC051470]|uniref:NAD(P)/FAD-dependent oxidoreductase n=1 Tax=Actinoplanes sp. NPDC051470 TaxID=3157224 RepID=UPI003435FF8B